MSLNAEVAERAMAERDAGKAGLVIAGRKAEFRFVATVRHRLRRGVLD